MLYYNLFTTLLPPSFLKSSHISCARGLLRGGRLQKKDFLESEVLRPLELDQILLAI